MPRRRHRASANLPQRPGELRKVSVWSTSHESPRCVRPEEGECNQDALLRIDPRADALGSGHRPCAWALADSLGPDLCSHGRRGSRLRTGALVCLSRDAQAARLACAERGPGHAHPGPSLGSVVRPGLGGLVLRRGAGGLRRHRCLVVSPSRLTISIKFLGPVICNFRFSSFHESQRSGSQRTTIMMGEAFTRRGFLPESDPLSRFPEGSELKILDELGHDLPSLLHDKGFRAWARGIVIPGLPQKNVSLPELRL